MPISSLKLAGQCCWHIYLIQPQTWHGPSIAAYTGTSTPTRNCESTLYFTAWQRSTVYSTLYSYRKIVVLLMNRAKPVSVCPQMIKKYVIAINCLAQHVWSGRQLVKQRFSNSYCAQYFCSSSVTRLLWFGVLFHSSFPCFYFPLTNSPHCCCPLISSSSLYYQS